MILSLKFFLICISALDVGFICSFSASSIIRGLLGPTAPCPTAQVCPDANTPTTGTFSREVTSSRVNRQTFDYLALHLVFGHPGFLFLTVISSTPYIHYSGTQGCLLLFTCWLQAPFWVPVLGKCCPCMLYCISTVPNSVPCTTIFTDLVPGY